MVDLAIETVGLYKFFQGRPALTGLDLCVPPGSIYGFLGRNGAGKTTTMKLLMGILQPDRGSVNVLGVSLSDPANGVRIRQRIGFVTEDKELYPYMTIRQVTQFTRSFFPRWREDLEQRYRRLFDLPLDKKIPDLSKGMRSKLILLLAIARGIELLILDEPTDGLDPVSVEELLRELVSLSATEGTTIFFSSHQLHEVEQIADHITIVEHGRSVVSGTLDDLKGRYRRVNIVLPENRADPIPWLDGVERVTQEGRTLSLLISSNASALVQQARSLPGAAVEVTSVAFKRNIFGTCEGDINAVEESLARNSMALLVDAGRCSSDDLDGRTRRRIAFDGERPPSDACTNNDFHCRGHQSCRGGYSNAISFSSESGPSRVHTLHPLAAGQPPSTSHRTSALGLARNRWHCHVYDRFCLESFSFGERRLNSKRPFEISSGCSVQHSVFLFHVSSHRNGSGRDVASLRKLLLGWACLVGHCSL